MAGYVYIVTNRPGGTLYIGVTSNIRSRAWQHREGVTRGFASRYDLTKLVLVEVHETMPLAIAREKAMKQWNRAWKVALIEAVNPGWEDLYLTLNA